MKTRNNRGAAAIEFALVLPILVLLLFGMIEFSLLFYDKAVITNASRVGARYGTMFENSSTMPMTCDRITAKINEYVASNLITFGAATGATIEYPNGCVLSTPGAELRVIVRYQYDYLVIPGLVPAIADGVLLTAETRMFQEG